MRAVTDYARAHKNNIACSVELRSCLQLNDINTPSFRASCYGNYVTVWAELKCTGRILHMERLIRQRSRGRRAMIVRQALRQYRTLQALRDTISPTQEFMRIVLVRDLSFETTNSYKWVKMGFLRVAIRTLLDQVRLVGISHQSQFEYRIRSAGLSGIADIYDECTGTVIEIKTCRFVPKEAFAQVTLYAHMLSAKRAFVCNCVDGGVWQLRPNITNKGEQWLDFKALSLCSST